MKVVAAVVILFMVSVSSLTAERPVDGIQVLEREYNKPTPSLASSCVYLGTVSGYAARAYGSGGKQTVTYQLRDQAKKVGADTVIVSLIGQGQAADTSGTGEAFRCSGSWPTGGVPPVMLPVLTAAVGVEGAVSVPRASQPSSAPAAVVGLGEFRLGMSYPELKTLLNAHKLPVKQAASSDAFNPFQIEEQAAFILPKDDARGRRWLFVPRFSPIEEIPSQDAVLALAFDSRQVLISVAVLTIEKKGKVEPHKLVEKLTASLDTKYRRIAEPASGMKLPWGYWVGTDSTPVVALLAMKKPASGLILLYTADPVQLTPLIAGL